MSTGAPRSGSVDGAGGALGVPVSSQAIELEIGGMTCASCAARIEKKLNRMPGVEASVNYATERAQVSLPEGTDVAAAIATVEATGYTASLPELPVETSPAGLVSLRRTWTSERAKMAERVDKEGQTVVGAGIDERGASIFDDQVAGIMLRAHVFSIDGGNAIVDSSVADAAVPLQRTIPACPDQPVPRTASQLHNARAPPLS